jgi:hypothetical protein
MARTAMAAAALLLFVGAAMAAIDCSSVAGCTACTYSTSEKKGLKLMCTACADGAYVLKGKKGRCGARQLCRGLQ